MGFGFVETQCIASLRGNQKKSKIVFCIPLIINILALSHIRKIEKTDVFCNQMDSCLRLMGSSISINNLNFQIMTEGTAPFEVEAVVETMIGTMTGTMMDTMIGFSIIVFVIIFVLPVIVFVIVLIMVLRIRGANKRKRYEMQTEVYSKALQAGQPLPADLFVTPQKTKPLNAGIIWISIGIGIALTAVITHTAIASIGIIPFFIGVAFVIIHFIEKKKSVGETPQ